MGRRWIWAPQLCACSLTHALPSPPAPTARRTVSPHPPGAIKRHRRLGCGRVEEGALNQHFILQRTWSPCLFRDTKPRRARACCITQGSTSSGLSLRQLDSSPQPSQILEPARSTQLTSFRVGRQSWAQKQFQQTWEHPPSFHYPPLIPARLPQPCLCSSSELPHNPWDVIDFTVYKAHLLTQAC